MEEESPGVLCPGLSLKHKDYRIVPLPVDLYKPTQEIPMHLVGSHESAHLTFCLQVYTATLHAHLESETKSVVLLDVLQEYLP